MGEGEFFFKKKDPLGSMRSSWIKFSLRTKPILKSWTYPSLSDVQQTFYKNPLDQLFSQIKSLFKYLDLSKHKWGQQTFCKILSGEQSTLGYYPREKNTYSSPWIYPNFNGGNKLFTKPLSGQHSHLGSTHHVEQNAWLNPWTYPRLCER